MKRPPSYFSLILVAATALGGVCSECRADDRAEAKEHYIKGTKAFELGAYEEAIAEYSAAYRLRDDPALLYNLAQSNRLANHPTEALRFYRLFLMKVPDASNRAEVQDKIAELQKLVEAQKKTQNMPPDSVKAPDVAGAGASSAAPPVVERTTTPTRQDRDIASPDAGTVLHKARTEKIAGIVTAVAGLGLVVGGIVTGVLAQQAGDKLTSLNQNMQTFDYSQQQTGKTDQLLEGVFIGVGAAAVVAGGVVFLLGRREQRRAQRVSFAPANGHSTLRSTVEASF